MTTQGDVDPRLQLVQDFFQRYYKGSVDEAVKLLAPNVEYRFPGAKEPFGSFVGSAAVAEHFGKFLEMVVNPVDVLKWDDWLLGSTHVAGLVHIELQRSSRVEDFRLLYLMGISHEMTITSIEAFCSDQAKFDRFFSW